MIAKNWENCRLINRFIEICEEEYATSFNFALHVENLRTRVVNELAYINQLFPEYTPHDEKYHINQLFHISDIILGPELIDHMNAAELFILICGIYTHDWGMAVGQPEKAAIRGMDSPYPAAAMLDGEAADFAAFLEEKKISGTDLPDAVWQDYVRKTHALRSGRRVRDYFDSINRGLGDAIASVCEAHWLDIRELESTSFPTDFAVVNTTVNLRALGIYLRLIDLYDLSGDRTPYVLWKYISPQNPQSRMEWDKHRAIYSVGAPDYSNGRILKIDGRTEDIEVWSKLKDLENWSNEQLRSCLDLMARMNHAYHRIDIYLAQWNIKAEGFNPINIQFNFDRSKVFKILSDEIYDKDDYVFLRELLQNSIDAIKVRKGILDKHDASINGKIEIDISTGKDGNQVISFTDNGVGMDEYIVRNYLSAIGKSYYNSEDFEKMGVKIDPISKFGIGILSCFKIAHQINIITRQEPYINSSNKALSIEIPLMLHAFRIKEININKIEIGTTVRVFVNPALFNANNPSDKLEVFNYLKKIAAFTPFPVYITENGRRSVIVPTGSGIKPDEKVFANYYKVGAEPHPDASKLGDFFESEQIDIATLPGLEEYEGYLVFQHLRPGYTDFIRNYIDFQFYDGELVQKKDYKDTFDIDIDYIPYSILTLASDMAIAMPEHEIVDGLEEARMFNEEVIKYGQSSCQMPNYSFFNNGILVPQVDIPVAFTKAKTYESKYPPPALRINLRKSLNTQINVSRSRLLSGTGFSWDLPVHEALETYVLNKGLPPIIAMGDPWQKLLSLSRLALVYRLSLDRIWAACGPVGWPVVLIGQEKIIVKTLEEIDIHTLEPFPLTRDLDIYSDMPKRFGMFYGTHPLPKLAPIEGAFLLCRSSFGSFGNLPEIIKGALELSLLPFLRHPDTAAKYKEFLKKKD